MSSKWREIRQNVCTKHSDNHYYAKPFKVGVTLAQSELVEVFIQLVFPVSGKKQSHHPIPKITYL
jgi:hypothetical protein